MFGEYTILHDGDGLAIPFGKYGGNWDISSDETESNNILKSLVLHFEESTIDGLDIGSFKDIVSKGLFFNSNIPQGYGVGSSAALSAAIFSQFVKKSNMHFLTIKESLAAIESSFHGRSSGIDPLVSFLNKGIHIQENKIKILGKKKYQSHFFTIDTNQPRETKVLVDYYLSEYNKGGIFTQKMNELKSLNNNAIQLYKEESQELFQITKSISVIQYQYLRKMIPTSFQPIWERSLHSNEYCIKLNGAGGGGFLLGCFRDNMPNLDFTKQFKIEKI